MSRSLSSLSNPTPVKLLYITTVPGTLYFHLGQVSYMRQRGFQIEALSSPGQLPVQLSGDNSLKLYTVTMPRRITPLQDLIALSKIWWHLRHIKPDLIHASTPKGGLLGTLAGWLAGYSARIYQIRGLPMMTAQGYKYWLLWLSEMISCHLAHRVICVSHSIRQVAIETKLSSPNRIKVFLGGSSNGVDAEKRFNPSSYPEQMGEQLRIQYQIPVDALVIGFVGRLIRDKGVEELIQAWQLLQDEFPQAHLLMLGALESQDPIASEILTVIEQDDRIHWIGEVDETAPFYCAIDIVVLPTYREGLPNTLLEASAMERAIVATNVPGCIDVVESGVTGSLVAPYEVTPLADAIRVYLQSETLRKTHGQAARIRILRDFRQAAIWESIYQEYQDLLQEKGLLRSPSRGSVSTAIYSD